MAWIALAAIVLASLAPSLARAFALGGSSGWVQVCSAQGTRWIDAETAGSGHEGAPKARGLLDHCSFCASLAPVWGMPGSAPQLVLPVQHATAAPPAWLHAPRTLHAWSDAQARAPPPSA